MQKYVYRVLVVNTEMKVEGKRRDYDDLLEDDYVCNHLYYMVAANLQAKKSLSQPRTWRLTLCVPRDSIELEFDTICDGLWSVLGGAATAATSCSATDGKDRRECLYFYMEDRSVLTQCSTRIINWTVN